jgi:dTDP-4-amino-4,6-dideoxygalactose transaminase
LPLRTPHVARPDDVHSWHLYVLQLDLESLTIDRDRFIEAMAERGIGCSVHFIPLHLQPYWRDRYSLRPEQFPVASEVYRRAVSLPIYTRMTDDDVGRVIAAVRDVALRHSR